MDKEELQKIILNLKYITQCCKGGVPLTRLEKDYKDLLGTDIPFKDLGYSSLEYFIQSIPDAICLGRNNVGELIAEGVIDANTLHIASLISRQKSLKISANFPKRPSKITRKWGSSTSINYRQKSFTRSVTGINIQGNEKRVIEYESQSQLLPAGSSVSAIAPVSRKNRKGKKKVSVSISDVSRMSWTTFEQDESCLDTPSTSSSIASKESYGTSERIDELKAELEKEKNINEDLTSQFDQLKLLIKTAFGTVMDKEEKMMKLRTVVELTKEVEDLKSKLEKEEKINSNNLIEIARLNSLVKEGQDSLIAEQEIVAKLKQQLDEANAKFSTSDGNKFKDLKEIESLKSKLEMERKINADYSTQIVRLDSSARVCQESLMAEQKKVDNLQAQLNTAHADLIKTEQAHNKNIKLMEEATKVLCGETESNKLTSEAILFRINAAIPDRDLLAGLNLYNDMVIKPLYHYPEIQYRIGNAYFTVLFLLHDVLYGASFLDIMKTSILSFAGFHFEEGSDLFYQKQAVISMLSLNTLKECLNVLCIQFDDNDEKPVLSEKLLKFLMKPIVNSEVTRGIDMTLLKNLKAHPQHDATDETMNGCRSDAIMLHEACMLKQNAAKDKQKKNTSQRKVANHGTTNSHDSHSVSFNNIGRKDEIYTSTASIASAGSLESENSDKIATNSNQHSIDFQQVLKVMKRKKGKKGKRNAHSNNLCNTTGNT